MEKQVILTSAVRFVNPEDVVAYQALPVYALPCHDVEFNEVTRYVVGWRHIVLYGRTGRRLAVLKRRHFIGMAIDGQPVVIRGDGFQPFASDDVSDDVDVGNALDEVVQEGTPAIADGAIDANGEDDEE